eukprot:c13996_g1_i2.p1 GENE.c13996_g1_i2~~c13996_g1_i2.p1  ORF type:complete len:236 (+),score=31.67 c13996_g1_i2:47-709(+)
MGEPHNHLLNAARFLIVLPALEDGVSTLAHWPRIGFSVHGDYGVYLTLGLWQIVGAVGVALSHALPDSLNVVLICTLMLEIGAQTAFVLSKSTDNWLLFRNFALFSGLGLLLIARCGYQGWSDRVGSILGTVLWWAIVLDQIPEPDAATAAALILISFATFVPWIPRLSMIAAIFFLLALCSLNILTPLYPDAHREFYQYHYLQVVCILGGILIHVLHSK